MPTRTAPNAVVLLLAVLLAGLVGACGDVFDTDTTGTGSDAEPIENPEPVDLAAETADRLATWLEGDYDSADQEARDFSYYAISLRMCAIDLPDLGERILYVEQAFLENPTAPYRQRLYRVVPQDDDTAVSEVWQATSEATEDALVGLCDDPTAFSFTAEDFEPREGCAVTMTWDGEIFSGSTSDNECLSSLNGATYATAEVSLGSDLLTSWDRGYNSNDVQVWGATAGAYEFVRRTESPTVD